jgi:transcriptional regulator with XRE-family HTH domain
MDDETLKARLGGAIRERRTSMGFSQESFADSIAMHRAYYSKIERGERNLTMLTLWRVAEGLRLSLAELMKAAKL